MKIHREGKKIILLAFAVSVFTDLNVIYVIIACALIGLVTSLFSIGSGKFPK